MSIGALLAEADARGVTDLAFRICSYFVTKDAEVDWDASETYRKKQEVARILASCSTDAAAGYGTATRPSKG